MRECQSIEVCVLVRSPYKREPRIGRGGCRKAQKVLGLLRGACTSPEPLFCRDWGPEQAEPVRASPKCGVIANYHRNQLKLCLLPLAFVLRPTRGGGLCNVLQDPVKYTTKASGTPLCTGNPIGSCPIIRMDTDPRHPRKPFGPTTSQNIDGKEKTNRSPACGVGLP